MSDAPSLQLTLGMEADTYTADDTVFGTLELGNVGSTSIVVNQRMALDAPFLSNGLREVFFRVLDPGGEPLDFALWVNTRALKHDDFVVLMPEEAIKRRYRLSRAYRLDEAGEYTVQAVYENQSGPDEETAVWKGRIESNTVTFTIQEKPT